MRFIPYGPNAPAGLPVIITIQKGDDTLRFTTADRTIELSSTEVYQMVPGADMTGFQASVDGSPANADLVVNAVEGGLFLPGDGLRGMLGEWPIRIELVNPNNPHAGLYPLLDGVITGSVDEDANGRVTIAANGPLRLAQEVPICEHFSLVCRADLGDDRCKIPILLNRDIAFYDIQRAAEYVRKDVDTGTTGYGLARVKDAYGRVRIGTAGTVDDYQNISFECTTAGTTANTEPVWNTTIGGTTTDGTVVWTCRNAWFRSARAEALDAFTIEITSFSEPRASDASWYVDGGIFFRSNTLSAFPKHPVKSWNPTTQRLSLFLPVRPEDVPAGTECELQPGCDRTRVHCFARFDNIVNGRFETFVPPPEAVLTLGRGV